MSLSQGNIQSDVKPEHNVSTQEHISDAIQRQLVNRITFSIEKHTAAYKEFEKIVATEVTHAAVKYGFEFNQRVYALQISAIDNLNIIKKQRHLIEDDFKNFNASYLEELNALYIRMDGGYEDWLKERNVTEEKEVIQAKEDMPTIAQLPQKKAEFNGFKLTKKNLESERAKILKQDKKNEQDGYKFDDDRKLYTDQITERMEMIQNLQRCKTECQTGKLSKKMLLQLRVAFVREADLYPKEINEYDNEGLTLLHHACNTLNIVLVKELLARNADPNIATQREGYFPAHLVAKQSSAAAVELLAILERHSKGAIAKKSEDNMTVLHMTATSGNIDVIRWLWLVQQQEFPINAADEMLACTPLHNAVYHNHIEVVTYLLIQNADHRIKNRLNETPLVCAIMQGLSHARIVSVFNEHGIGLTQSEKEYLLQQAKALPNNQIRECMAILTNGISPTEEKSISALPKSVTSPIIRIMQVAFSTHHLEGMVQRLSSRLVQEKRRLSSTQKTALETESTLLKKLQNSLQMGDLDLAIKMQLDKYIYQAFQGNLDLTDSGGYQILHYMSAFSDVSWLTYLKYAGAELASPATQNGYFPLHFAVHNCESTDAVFELLADSTAAFLAAKKDKEGSLALHRAAESGNLSAVAWLVESRSQNVNSIETDGSKSTPLHKAASGGYLDVVTYLLNKKANATIKDKFGETPLVSAIVQGRVQVIDAFLAGNTWLSKEDETYLASVAAQNSRKARLIEDCLQSVTLPHATNKGNLGAVKWLIESRAQNIDHREIGGSESTILHIAALCVHVDVVGYLLDKQANVEIKNKFSETPLVSAILQGRVPVARAFWARKKWLSEGDLAYLTAYVNQNPDKKMMIDDCLKVANQVNPTVSPVSSSNIPIRASEFPQSFVNQLRDQNVASSVLAVSPMSYRSGYVRKSK